MKDIIISLFDYSGSWSKPYKDAGYEVIQIDIKLDQDILTWDYMQIAKSRVYGILAAPVCTDFSVSGAQYWKAKDLNGQTEKSINLVKKSLEIVNYFNPVFWVLENPVGRINKLIPELASKRLLIFNPCDYGDPYTKKTILYGQFNPYLIQKPVKPIRESSQGSWLQKLGGKSERTKELRSITPAGFSRAFFEANNNLNERVKSQ